MKYKQTKSKIEVVKRNPEESKQASKKKQKKRSERRKTKTQPNLRWREVSIRLGSDACWPMEQERTVPFSVIRLSIIKCVIAEKEFVILLSNAPRPDDKNWKREKATEEAMSSLIADARCRLIESKRNLVLLALLTNEIRVPPGTECRSVGFSVAIAADLNS